MIELRLIKPRRITGAPKATSILKLVRRGARKAIETLLRVGIAMRLASGAFEINWYCQVGWKCENLL
jgi:hypothetical protein